MNKKFIGNGIIKNKDDESGFYRIILENEPLTKLLPYHKICGSHTIGSHGKLYYISSTTTSYYEFEVTE